jgi:hypothetical protein
VLSDHERRVLDEIERGLRNADPQGSHSWEPGPTGARAAVPDAEGYAVLAALSGVLAMLFITSRPGLTAMMLLLAVVNWKIAFGGGRLWRRFDRRDAGQPP